MNEYIPFYFGPRSPMLYVIQHGYNSVKSYQPECIVYCVIRIDQIIKNQIRCIFTDGHALDMLTTFYDGKELEHLSDYVSYDDVYTGYWADENDRDLKRRKEAELLIKDELPPNFICGYVVYNNVAKQVLMNVGIQEHLIQVRPNFYF